MARPASWQARRRGPAGTFGRLDPAGAVGLVAAFAVIGLAIGTGSAPARFIDLPSVLIVLGGTFAVTFASFSLAEFARLPRVVGAALSLTPPCALPVVANDALTLAEAARQETLPGLERRVEALARHGFLHRGLMLLLEGADRDAIERTLRREIAAMVERQRSTVGILRRAAEVAPAMGLIGTLIGLVQMLGHLDDPDEIGPAMAIALLTTLYGALLAHALFTPLAEKLQRRFEAELAGAELQLVAALAIADRENPRRLEAALNGLLAPDERLRRFD